VLGSPAVNAPTVRFVVLTGPIASGKSTIGRLAVEGTAFPFIPEDVDSLSEDREVLAGYYRAVAAFEELLADARTADPALVAAAQEAVFRTQQHFIGRRAARLRASAREGVGGLVERHPSDDIQVFSRRNLSRGLLTIDQFASLEAMMESELAGLPSPILTVFLHADADRLRERIGRRGRPQEAGLTRPENSYLEELNALYTSWHERCRGEKLLIRTDSLTEATIAAAVRRELAARGII